MTGTLRLVGFLIIILTVIGVVASSIVLWKVLVSNDKWWSSVTEEKYYDTIRLPGETDSDAIYRTVMKALKRYDDGKKGLPVEPLTEREEREDILYERSLDARKDYERSRKTYLMYIAGILAGSLFTIGFGLLLIAKSETVKELRKLGSIQDIQQS